MPVLVSVALAGAMPCIAQEAELLDPTRPMGWRAPLDTAVPETVADDQPASIPTLKLQGIFNVDGRRAAIISGQRVSVGDEVSGAEVLDVTDERVLLRFGGEIVELESALPVVKVPSPSAFAGDAVRLSGKTRMTR